jgi:hypothetical protein
MATMAVGLPATGINPMQSPAATGTVPGGAQRTLGNNTVANPTVTNPMNTVQNNPMAPVGAVVPGSTIQSNGIDWNDGSKTVTGDLKDTYGAGTGTAISQVLQGLGTTNDAAIQATLANINQQATKQYGNIQATQAASGVTANSSTAALASGDFWSGVNSQEQSTIANMENSQEQTLLSTLLDEGKAHGTDESTMDSIMNGIGDAGSLGIGPAAGGLSELLSL